MSLNPTSTSSIIMNFLLIIIESIYYVSNDVLYYNIFLMLLGYHIYIINEENILITKMDRLSVKKHGVRQVGTTNIYFAWLRTAKKSSNGYYVVG